MPRLPTIEVYVQNISMTVLEDAGFEINDPCNGAEKIISEEQRAFYLSCLTKRQQTVAELLDEGYTRHEVASTLDVCLQSIHQIVLRIRKRLITRGQVKM